MGLVLLGLIAVLGSLTLAPALGLRDQLQEARAAMEEGRAQLLSGSTERAEEAFAGAEDRFQRAVDLALHPLIRLASFLPLIGRTPDTVKTMAEAGRDVARAARTMTSAMNGLPGRLAAPGPQRGALPVEILSEIAPSLERAQALTARAANVLAASKSTFLLGPVAEARGELAEELEDATRLLRSAAALAEVLPAFLGADEPRRYFFGAQSPAELRGTGGLIGAFSILTVSDGRIDFGPFEPIQRLEDLTPDEGLPPNLSLGERYEIFGGKGIWRNINMTPDFPSAATAIEGLYSAVEDEELDGTIVADPFALQTLVQATGPIDVEGTDVRLTPENTVEVLAHEAYGRFEDPAVRKLVLGDSARLVFERFVDQTVAADPIGAVRILMRAAADGHVLLHAVDPEIQRGLEIAGAAGELLDPEGDYLGVFANNAAGTKIDYYLDPAIIHSVQLGEDRSAQAVTSVALSNNAPSSGEAANVIGPYDQVVEAGENKSYLSTYCAASCDLESFEAPGEETEVIGLQEELGHPVFSTFVNIASGQTATLEFQWTVAEAWQGAGDTGRYLLTFQGQPTIRPTQLTVEILAPDGASIVNTSPELQVNGQRAVWSGPARPLMQFEIAFEQTRNRKVWVFLLLGAAALGLGSLTGLYIRRHRALPPKRG